MNPFLAEAPPVAPAAPAARRRGKPPPGIISAGGVDMARAHASNIRPAADTEGPRMETAKVVVAVETNPRRIKTMRNLEALRPPEGAAVAGASPWAKGAEPVDKAALPSANLPRDAGADQEKKKDKSGAFWLRLATVLVALLLIAGVVRRMRLYSQRNAPPAPTTTGGVLIPPPLPDMPAAGTGASPSTEPGTNGTGRPGTLRPKEPEEEVIDLDDPAGEPSPGRTARPVRVKPPPPPPPPKPTFSPIFELPGEK